MITGPKPGVKVIENRTDPAYDAAFNDIKKTVREDGFCSIKEYLNFVNKHNACDEVLIPALQNAGYGFIKTNSLPDAPEQEVIVDLRYMAAAMLLIYSDNQFAMFNSVLKCLKVMHLIGGWDAAWPITQLGGLLSETYSTYGHNFTDMLLANNADLSKEDEKAIKLFALRQKSAMVELAKNETELTAVFRLCMVVMTIVNGDQRDAKLYRTHDQKAQDAYNYFWKAACKIRDRSRTKGVKSLYAHPEGCDCGHKH